MDKLGIFRLLNSFFDFYKQNSVENSSSPSSSNQENFSTPFRESSGQSGKNNQSFFSPFLSLLSGKGTAPTSFDGGSSPSQTTAYAPNKTQSSAPRKDDNAHGQNGSKVSTGISLSGAPLQEKMLKTIRSHDDIVSRVINNGKKPPL